MEALPKAEPEVVNCPICGSKLEEARDWNPEIFGIGEDNPITGYVCNNSECKGWFCQCCGDYHPFGTSCSVAMVRSVRDDDGGYCYEDNRGRELYRKLRGEKV